MIGLAIIGILAAILIPNLGGCTIDTTKAERDAFAFGQKAHPELVTSTECMDVDSDQDGYVSCTVFLKEKDPLYIECRYGSGGCNGGSGCRGATGKTIDL